MRRRAQAGRAIAARASALAAGLALAASVASAALAPETSLRPLPRASEAAPSAPAGSGAAAEAQPAPRPVYVPVFYKAEVRPTPRPGGAGSQRAKALVAPRAALADGPASALAVAASLRPSLRPRGLRAPAPSNRPAKAAVLPASTAVRTPVPTVAINSKLGKVCGSKEIIGRKLAPIPGRINGCGIADPVQVYEVSGVRLSNPARMDCVTAKALNDWTKSAVKPTFGRLGGGIREYRVAAGYACRTRNNQPGAKISEHGKGRAIDISAFTLKNGQTITVLQGWNRKVEGKLLRSVHKQACKPFGTVLGPNADRFHRDHFHLDTARYRSGSYCR
ncbi:hypothetical protein PSA7680_01209 [Pseudoruegeria aquimaris]|uniref:Extensin-like C-terminal domain-containing protein n=1 Tax=Pseudoruegeria aquimaris TaxID=393663 RepID=A0A1Y5S111_9RHOB|nr:extensin family protein [Pseudoruegeria aquimaris]SLN27174.1 hypothetical protein PSA7680_01209 [Pseudoruegeria aquimaris]